MSLDTESFDHVVQGNSVIITIPDQHPLIQLARKLPWEELLLILLPDLKRTERLLWWVGRPLRVRIHVGVYLLQQLFNLTDRQAEYALHDNAAFQLFCGVNFLKKWHVPDHTKIEEFRSRLFPETQRKIANIISVHAVTLHYANPAKLDIDSTIQEANISYPSAANLLVKVAGVAKRLVKPLNAITNNTKEIYHISLKQMKAKLLYYFNLKRQHKFQLSGEMLKSLWRDVFAQVWPILKDSHLLIPLLSLPKYWNLRRALEQLQWNGYQLLEQVYDELFEGKIDHIPIYALHAYEIQCFNKNKLNKKKQYGRAFQLGRIEGNFAIVSECTSVQISDAQSLPSMIREYEFLFGKNRLHSVATDKGYYSHHNQLLLENKKITEIGLPRPERDLNVARNTTSSDVMEKLHNRRAGIEAIIGHIKHGGQLDRSRMKSDRTTLAAGYAAVLGFNLRQLKRYAIGKIGSNFGNSVPLEPKSDKMCPLRAEKVLYNEFKRVKTILC